MSSLKKIYGSEPCKMQNFHNIIITDFKIMSIDFKKYS